MALGSGSITFSQIVNEWSERFSAGKITASPGSPVSMRQFLRGYPVDWAGIPGYPDPNGFVPNYYDTTSGIAASGNLVMSTFKSTNAEQSAQVCLGAFADDRYYYHRTITDTDFAPVADIYGEVRQQITNHYNRRSGSASTVNQYTNPGTLQGHSKWTTIVDWVIGAQNNLTSWTGQYGTAGVDAYYTQNQSSYAEMSCVLSHYRYIPRDAAGGTISLTTSWTRLNNNSGSWHGQYLLPGKWYVRQVRNQPVTNSSNNAGGAQTNYVVTVPAGEAYLVLTYNYTTNDAYLDANAWPYSSDGGKVYCTSYRWYNACLSAFYVNRTGSSQTVTFPSGLYPVSDDAKNGSGAWLYNIGATWFGDTSSGTYHRDFLLARTF
jgi:hypothetical protein